MMKATALVALLTLGIVLSTACSGTSDISYPAPHDDALTDPARTPVVSIVATTPVPTPVRASSAAPTPTVTPRVVPTNVASSVNDLLSQYLWETFGRPNAKAPWYDNIVRVSVRFNTAVIRTDLTASPADRARAETICQVVSAFPHRATADRLGALAVEVYGQSDRLLASGRTVAARRQGPDPLRQGP